MKTVTTREVQHHLARVMAVVEQGEEVVITRRGEKLAILSPFREKRKGSIKVPDFRKVRERLGVKACGGPNIVIEMRDEEG